MPNLQPLEVGNGIDTKRFLAKIDPHDGLEQRLNTFVYAGTASEWHGADIFIRAFASRRDELTDYTLQFIGGGSEVDNLRYLARRLGVGQRVSFEPSLRPEQLGPRLANCTLALASLKPHSGYDFAFPTKLYSAAACGAPLLHTGGGPGADFVLQRVDGRSIGEAVAFNEVDVAAALVHAVQVPPDARSVTRRLAVRRWAQLNVDIQSVAENAVNALIPLEGTRS
ncbi:MAG: glycosyltransferase [Canibacter sp.]